MALAGDRNTQSRPFAPRWARYKVKSGSTVYAGSLVATDSDGYLVPADDDDGQTVIGRADEQVVGDGTVKCAVQQGSFKWENSSGSAVTQAAVGKACYVEDDQTVALTGGDNSIVAGIVEEIDSDGGIWVTTMHGLNGEAIAAGYPSAGAIDAVSTETALDPDTATSLLTVDGTMAMTLAAGSVEGQRKFIRCVSASNSPAATITYAGTKDTVAKTTMLFNAAADYVWLEYHATGGWITLIDNSVTYG